MDFGFRDFGRRREDDLRRSIQVIFAWATASSADMRLYFHCWLTQRVEFYGKVIEWRTRWTDKARPLYHVTLFRIKALRTIRDLRKRRLAYRHRTEP
jgi:hypothetical protein